LILPDPNKYRSLLDTPSGPRDTLPHYLSPLTTAAVPSR